MSTNTVEEVIGDFSEIEQESFAEYKPITIWVSPTCKKKYVELQKRSGRKFCDKLRKLMTKAVDITHSKIS